MTDLGRTHREELAGYGYGLAYYKDPAAEQMSAKLSPNLRYLPNADTTAATLGPLASLSALTVFIYFFNYLYFWK